MFLCCCAEDVNDKAQMTFERPSRAMETPVTFAERTAPIVSVEAASAPVWEYQEPTDEPLRPPDELQPAPEQAAPAVAQQKPVPAERKIQEPFFVTVERTPKSTYGVDLSAAGKFCIVNSVTAPPSLVGSWNATAGEASRVRKLDRLLGINGFTSDKGKDLLEKLRDTKGQVVLEMSRPSFFEVEVTPAPSKGLGIQLKAGPGFVMVTSIEDGPVQEYNARALPDQQIKLSCRILSINGKEGKGDELMAVLKDASGLVKLSVVHWN
jgi:hypothetical protein